MQIKSYLALNTFDDSWERPRLSKPFETFVAAVADELEHNPKDYTDIQLTFSHRRDRWRIEASPDPDPAPITITVELTPDEADIVQRWYGDGPSSIVRKIHAAVKAARP